MIYIRRTECTNKISDKAPTVKNGDYIDCENNKANFISAFFQTALNATTTSPRRSAEVDAKQNVLYLIIIAPACDMIPVTSFDMEGNTMIEPGGAKEHIKNFFHQAPITHPKVTEKNSQP